MEKTASEREKREVVYALTWRSMIDPREKYALNAHSHEFAGFVNMPVFHFSELYLRCKKLWRLSTTVCNAGTKTPRWYMHILAALT